MSNDDAQLEGPAEDVERPYVGHAAKWDEIVIDGSIEARDCAITYLRHGRKQAVAVMHRDHEGLLAKIEFERSNSRRDACPVPRKLSEVA